MTAAVRLAWTGMAIGVALAWGLAAARAETPQLAVVGGPGVPGGTVAVEIQLSGDVDGSAVTADLDIRFPPDLVELSPPVSLNCRVAERLTATHQIGGRPLEPGLVSVAIFARNLSILPLGDGALATCDFHILAAAGEATAPLTLDFVGLGDSQGGELPVVGVPGVIVVGGLPCVGDCTGNHVVTVDEVIRGVRIVLGELPVSNCPAFDRGGGVVTVSDLIAAVNSVLFGCPVTG